MNNIANKLRFTVDGLVEHLWLFTLLCILAEKNCLDVLRRC